MTGKGAHSVSHIYLPF